jgi:predicted Zn-dependent peptidase
MVELFSRAFSVAKGRSKPKRTSPVITGVHSFTEQRSIQQSHILLQAPVSGSTAEDRHALAILNVILGDGMTSRLNRKVRELKGLAYNIYSQLQQFRDIGIMAIYAGVDPGNVDRARKLILAECKSIASDTITPVELRRAMMQIRASRIMALESLNSRIGSMAKGLLETGAPEDPYTELADLEKTSLDQVHALAATVCQVDNWSEYLLIPES